MSDYDAVVIGAGHNGLTTANYLAKGGMRVCVLEQRSVVGGAAVTETFHPGYRNSTFSYVVSLLRPEVIKDLGLAQHGYEAMALENALYIDSGGDYLLLPRVNSIIKRNSKNSRALIFKPIKRSSARWTKLVSCSPSNG